MSHRTTSYRNIISIAAAALVGIACVSTDALAFRGGFRAGGFHAAGFRAGGYRVGGLHAGGVYRGGLYRPGVAVGAAVGAAAVGAAAAAPYYGDYYAPACGYYPYLPCY